VSTSASTTYVLQDGSSLPVARADHRPVTLRCFGVFTLRPVGSQSTHSTPRKSSNYLGAPFTFLTSGTPFHVGGWVSLEKDRRAEGSVWGGRGEGSRLSRASVHSIYTYYVIIGVFLSLLSIRQHHTLYSVHTLEYGSALPHLCARG
jgi:hypothetical protein